MKTISIGDTHGMKHWADIVEQEKYAHKFVFIGDYFDSFDVPFDQQIENFQKILEFKKANPAKVVLLIGNHDFHYLVEGEEYSGYQKDKAKLIGTLLNENLNLMQMCYMQDDYIFTHAGVTQTWADENKISEHRSDMTVEAQINSLFEKDMRAFIFSPSTLFDNTGESVTQPPIWVRPGALLTDPFMGNAYKQVVGHTQQKGINTINGITFIDVLDCKKEYIIIQDNKLQKNSL